MRPAVHPGVHLSVPQHRVNRRPFPPAFTSSTPQTRAAGRPRRWPFTPSSPRSAQVGHDDVGRAVGGAGGPSDAWNRPRCWPSTPCPHPNPKVRRVGFTLDDPYVAQVWAGVIGPFALLALRRLPVLWRERGPALIDLRELGQSLGLGPSLARSGRTWRTVERLVGFGMAHWLPGVALGVRTEVCRSAAASSHGCPGGPARSTTGCSACTSTGSPSPTPTGPLAPTSSSTPPASRPPRPRPAPPPRHHPRPRPPTMTLPPGPRRCLVLVPRGSPAVVPHRQTQRAHPCRCPCGAPAHRPPSVTR
jgi:hypothetical protein